MHNNMTKTLYPYQKKAVETIRAILNDGGRPLLMAPTGAGKTTIAAEIFAKVEPEPGRPKVFVVHMSVLRSQAQRVLSDQGAIVTTIQSLLLSPEQYKNAALVCWDECHHLQGDEWRKAVELFAPGTPMFGLSATPYSSAMHSLFTEIVTAARVEELVEGGFILPVAIMTPGEQFVAKLGADERIDGARAYASQYRGRQAIHFEPTIAWCQRAKATYDELGIRSEILCGETPAQERETLVSLFAQKHIAVLISAIMLAEGFDAPCAEVLVAGRAFDSDVLLQQAVGRVRRTYPGKEQAVIVDCTGCCVGRPSLNHTDDSLIGSLPETGSREAADRRAALRAVRLPLPVRWVECDDWILERPETLAEQIRRSEARALVAQLESAAAAEQDAARKAAIKEKREAEKAARAAEKLAREAEARKAELEAHKAEQAKWDTMRDAADRRFVEAWADQAASEECLDWWLLRRLGHQPKFDRADFVRHAFLAYHRVRAPYVQDRNLRADIEKGAWPILPDYKPVPNAYGREARNHHAAFEDVWRDIIERILDGRKQTYTERDERAFDFVLAPLIAQQQKEDAEQKEWYRKNGERNAALYGSAFDRAAAK